jgi:acyl-coenzyme A synthetase/AMP-(fatty) acid ligase
VAADSLTDILNELRSTAGRIPKSIALASVRGAVNYGDFVKAIDAVAAHAAHLGMRAGQTILLHCQHTDIRLMLTLGLARIGAVVGSGVLPETFAASGLKVDTIITEERDIPQDRRVFRLTPQWFQPNTERKTPSVQENYSLVFSSSGSTGKPKLVKFDRAAVEYRVRSKGEDEYFLDPPVYFSTAGNTTISTIADFLITLTKGGIVVHSTERSPRHIVNTINLYRPNYVAMAPSLLVRVLKLLREQPRNLEKIAFLRLTGAYCSLETREEAMKLLAREVVTSFGATEIGRVSWGRLGDTRKTQGSVGRIIPGLEVETVDDEDRPLPAGSEGEIRIKLPKAAAGSYPTAQGDQSALRDGWFYPGDIGRVDAEGNLIVTGRKSLVINLGGNKISPEVAESALERMAEVADVGVLGV